MSRFEAITDEDCDALDAKRDSKNTKRVTKRSVTLFRTFLVENGESDEFEHFSKVDLNKKLRLFFGSVRKMDGSYMKKASLDSIKYGLPKYLKENCGIDMKDPEFVACQTTFKGKVADLKKKGLGAIDHKVEISEEDLLKLRDPDSLVFNSNTPCGLQKKVWFDIMFFLCRRGRENLREMTKSTFAVGTDANGKQFVHQVEDESDKNHNENANSDDTVGEGKMYERKDDPNCPVETFLKYIGKLNPGHNSLWQRPLEQFETNDPVWYCKSPVGTNSLARWMSDISETAKLSRRYTNHCIRATSVSTLDRAGVEARHIMRISGHKSEASIRSYSRRLTDNKKREISETLSKSIEPAVPGRDSVERTVQPPVIVSAAESATQSLNSASTAGHLIGNISAGLETISESDLLEIFKDDNVFVEVAQQSLQNELNQQNAAPNINSNQGNIDNQMAGFNRNPQYSVDSVQNYINSNQGNSQPVNAYRPSCMYNINPNLNNCVVYFHFSGK